MKFFQHLKDMIFFGNLPIREKEIVFYSEGIQYWPYLKELLFSFLKISQKKICYVSSSHQDPGLELNHKNLKKFCIGDRSIRHHFFKSLNCKMLIMTMPDLGNYHILKSDNKINYVYAQHSLNSLHMAYRKKAFNNYDTILCAGKHHEIEIKKIETYYNLKEKKTFRYRYEPPYAIKKNSRYNKHYKKNSTILIAPSWGNHGLVESDKVNGLIHNLLIRDYNVIFRPHPETIKYFENKIQKTEKIFGNNLNFSIEKVYSGFETLIRSDILITDWSGIAFDFALGLKRPVIFANTKPKINNNDYKKIYDEVIEISIRNKIGRVLDCKDIPNYIHKKRFMSYSKVINSGLFFKNDADDVVSNLISLL